MSKKACLIQLHSGDAVSGVVSRRMWPFTYLRVEMAELHDAATQETVRADGVFLVPKRNVMYVQQIVRVVPTTMPAQSKITLPGPLTSDKARENPKARDAASAVR
jgi:hypothetical protein